MKDARLAEPVPGLLIRNIIRQREKSAFAKSSAPKRTPARASKRTPARAEAPRSPLGEVSANEKDVDAPASKKTKTSGSASASGAKTPRTPKDAAIKTAATRATRTSRLRAAK